MCMYEQLYTDGSENARRSMHGASSNEGQLRDEERDYQTSVFFILAFKYQHCGEEQA